MFVARGLVPFGEGFELSVCLHVFALDAQTSSHSPERRQLVGVSLTCECVFAVSVVVGSACHHSDSSRPLLPSVSRSHPPVTWPSKQS